MRRGGIEPNPVDKGVRHNRTVAKLGVKQIQTRVVELLACQPSGMRFSDIVGTIWRESPETPRTTISAQVAALPKSRPNLVHRPARGLFAIKIDGGASAEPVPQLAPQMSPATSVRELWQLGFVEVGHWETDGLGIRGVLHQCSERSRILYAFVVDDRAMYIGKSRRSLKQRMDNYAVCGPSQRTNFRVKDLILKELEAGRKVRIYALADFEPLSHQGVPIDVAAGIEDELIERFRPPWNA